MDGSYLLKIKFLSPKNAFRKSWLKFSELILRIFFFISSIHLRYFLIISPWYRAQSFIWTNLYPLCLRMLYSEFGWMKWMVLSLQKHFAMQMRFAANLHAWPYQEQLAKQMELATSVLQMVHFHTLTSLLCTQNITYNQVKWLIVLGFAPYRQYASHVTAA